MEGLKDEGSSGSHPIAIRSGSSRVDSTGLVTPGILAGSACTTTGRVTKNGGLRRFNMRPESPLGHTAYLSFQQLPHKSVKILPCIDHKLQLAIDPRLGLLRMAAFSCRITAGRRPSSGPGRPPLGGGHARRALWREKLPMERHLLGLQVQLKRWRLFSQLPCPLECL